MKIEIKKLGVVKDCARWPQEISHYIEIKKVYYDNNIEDMQKAMKEIGEYECWDSVKRVFCKTL